MATVTNAYVPTASTTDAATYTSPSFTPAAGDLLVAFPALSDTALATPPGLTASANGITFTLITSALRVTSQHRMYLYVADQFIPSSPAAMTLTMNVTGDPATGCVLMCARVAGMSRTGAGAVRQTTKLDNQAAGTPALVFSQPCVTWNPTLAALFRNAAAALTPPTSYTEHVDTSYATPTSGASYVSRNSGFTGTTITWGSASGGQYGAIAVELDAEPTPRPIRRNLAAIGRSVW